MHKSGDDAVGSLLLGLYEADGTLASVGVIGAFPMATRRQLFTDLQPLVTSFDEHPWNWAANEAAHGTRARTCHSYPCDLSGWSRFDMHMEGERFRHTAQFNRWRPDRDPRSCTYDQLDQPLAFRLDDVVPGLGPGKR